MKLLFVAPAVGLQSETFISDLLCGLEKQIGEFDLLCGDCYPESFSIPRRINVHTYPFMALTKTSDRLRYRLRPGHSWQEGDGDAQTPFDRQARRILDPLLDRIEPDVVYLEFGTTLARCAPILAGRGIPIVAHLHGHDVTAALASSGYRTALATGLQMANRIVVASRHMARLAILAGAPTERVEVVRLGVNVESVEPLPWSDRRMQNPSAVFLGRMTPKKNPIALIEAFRLVLRKCPDATLDLIGDGPELENAKQRASRYGLSQSVFFRGAMQRRHALDIVRTKWVYAQHSVTSFEGDQEGFGLSLAEAATLELPVVATLHNGFPEQVVEGETGFLVPEYAFDTMAERLLALFDHPDLAQKFGEAGRQRVLELYDPSRRFMEIAEILQRVAINYMREI